MGQIEAARGETGDRRRPGLLDHVVAGRPLSALSYLALSGYSFWMGFIIDHITINLPAAQLVGYRGPLTICSLRGWAFIYLTLGFLFLIRLTLLGHRILDFIAHLVCMAPLVAWAAGFDYSHPTTGQPAYTFIVVFVFTLPFLTRIIERWQAKLAQEARQ